MDLKAADQGDVAAQGMLAVLYSMGQGVPHDDAEAYFWFDIAASVKGPTGEVRGKPANDRGTNHSRSAGQGPRIAWQRGRPRTHSRIPRNEFLRRSPAANLRNTPRNHARYADCMIQRAHSAICFLAGFGGGHFAATLPTAVGDSSDQVTLTPGCGRGRLARVIRVNPPARRELEGSWLNQKLQFFRSRDERPGMRSPE